MLWNRGIADEGRKALRLMQRPVRAAQTLKPANLLGHSFDSCVVILADEGPNWAMWVFAMLHVQTQKWVFFFVVGPLEGCFTGAGNVGVVPWLLFARAPDSPWAQGRQGREVLRNTELQCAKCAVAIDETGDVWPQSKKQNAVSMGIPHMRAAKTVGDVDPMSFPLQCQCPCQKATYFVGREPHIGERAAMRRGCQSHARRVLASQQRNEATCRPRVAQPMPRSSPTGRPVEVSLRPSGTEGIPSFGRANFWRVPLFLWASVANPKESHHFWGPS